MSEVLYYMTCFAVGGCMGGFCAALRWKKWREAEAWFMGFGMSVLVLVLQL